MSKCAGIYAIFCQSTRKAYIGSTQNMSERWRIHRYYLEANRHSNCYLQRAWNKHGGSRFDFIILERVADLKLLTRREQFWLDKWRATNAVFNCGAIAENARRGAVMSSAQKRKISIALKNNKNSLGHRHGREMRRQMAKLLCGNQRGAKPYPAFRHHKTGQSIPPGHNLSATCRTYGLCHEGMRKLAHGAYKQWKGWELAEKKL